MQIQLQINPALIAAIIQYYEQLQVVLQSFTLQNAELLLWLVSPIQAYTQEIFSISLSLLAVIALRILIKWAMRLSAILWRFSQRRLQQFKLLWVQLRKRFRKKSEQMTLGDLIESMGGTNF